MEPVKKPLTVYGYARVSTENQLENYSIDEQVDRLKAYCTARGWSLQNLYIDAGYSGGNINRPDLQRLLKDLQSTPPDIVLVNKLDRLSRSQKDTMMLIEDTFLAQNIDFVSINENFDTSTPFGRAMVGILAVFAQLEKDQITERFTMGRIGRSKAGYYHGGSIPPTGYKYIDGELVVDEYVALQVQEVYQAFLSGKSINSILNTMREKYGGAWNNANTVRNVLRNSIYIGKVKFKGIEYPGHHRPLVSVDDYEKVQELMHSADRENRKTSAQKTPFRAGYLLSSLIYCQRCGARYSANHGFYKCYSRSKSSKKFIKDPSCKNDKWEIAKLDGLVLNAIFDLLDNQDKLDALYETTQKQEVPSPDLQAIETRIKEIDKQLTRILDLYQVGSIPLEQISQRLDSMNAEKMRLQKELAMNPQEEREIKWHQFVEALNCFNDAFETLDIDNKRLLVGSIIEAVVIDGQNVSIRWRL